MFTHSKYQIYLQEENKGPNLTWTCISEKQRHKNNSLMIFAERNANINMEFTTVQDSLSSSTLMNYLQNGSLGTKASKLTCKEKAGNRKTNISRTVAFTLELYKPFTKSHNLNRKILWTQLVEHVSILFIWI